IVFLFRKRFCGLGFGRLLLGLIDACPLCVDLSIKVRDRRLCLVDLRLPYSHLIVARIDLDQQSTRTNELISGDWNVDNSTGHLRTDGHDAGIDEGIVSRFILASVPPPDHDGNVADNQKDCARAHEIGVPSQGRAGRCAVFRFSLLWSLVPRSAHSNPRVGPGAIPLGCRDARRYPRVPRIEPDRRFVLRHADYLGYILLRRALLTRTGVRFRHKLEARSRVAQRNRDELSAIAGLHSHQHGMFALVTQLCELLANVRRRRHRVTGNIEDHVAFLHAAACRRSIGVDRRHGNAAATGAVDITRWREGETQALCTVPGRVPALFAGAGLTLVRPAAEGERQGLVLTVVEHGELHRGTWRNRCDLPREIARVLDVLAVDSRDNVTSNDASLCGRAASLGLIDDGTFGLLHAEA